MGTSGRVAPVPPVDVRASRTSRLLHVVQDARRLDPPGVDRYGRPMRALLVTALHGSIFAALLPPLVQSPGLTSGFGEYREGRCDRGTGLVASEQKVTFDGVRVPAEYDVEAGRLTWWPRAPLAAGRHAIVVEAVDALGNRSSVHVAVEVR